MSYWSDTDHKRLYRLFCTPPIFMLLLTISSFFMRDMAPVSFRRALP